MKIGSRILCIQFYVRAGESAFSLKKKKKKKKKKVDRVKWKIAPSTSLRCLCEVLAT